MLENFHFIQPLWLLALIPLSLLAWRVYRPGDDDNPWRRIVDARLLPLLMAGRAHTENRAVPWLLAAGWIIAVLALANPTWERKPLPIYQTTAARVIVLELSRSMYASDLKPSRLVRARYKIEDVLAQSGEGETGLVVYAGDAFTVSPLTRDVNTIRAMLPAVDPGIMPARGSRADLGLLRAGKLLRQAGVAGGQILLLADGVEADKAAASERAAASLRSDGYRVSVLGIGTEQGAPLTDAQGELVRDAAGRIENSRLDTATLQAIARAGGGEYRSISDNGRPLRALLEQPLDSSTTTQASATTQGWKQQGPLLAVLLLPLAALAFRRNWLLGLVLLLGLMSPPQPAMASTWSNLWQRPDQQAAKAFAAGEYARAATLATDAYRRASAEYRHGDYALAADDFSRAAGADADYDRGNALAKLGRYPDAIAAYDKSIRENPGNADARANKAAVEALLKRQQAQQPASAAHNGQSQKDQSQSGGAGQNSAPNTAGAQASAPGKTGQSGTSPGTGQQSAKANDARGPAQKGEPSRANGKDTASRNTASAKDSAQPSLAAAAAAQQAKAANEFAAAAQKLREQRSGTAKTGANPPPRATPGANPSGQAQAAGNPMQQAQGESADSAQPLDREQRMAAQQWLRRIPDDPGGLLRRKFLYQYRQRIQHRDADMN